MAPWAGLVSGGPPWLGCGEDQRCGTAEGFYAARNEFVEPCGECREALNAFKREYHERRLRTDFAYRRAWRERRWREEDDEEEGAG